CAGSKPFTSPAMRVGNALASKCVIGPMPLLPATTFFHAVATSLPTGETMPIPVTTTRRLFMGTPSCLVLQVALRAMLEDVRAQGGAIRQRIVHGPTKRKLRT